MSSVSKQIIEYFSSGKCGIQCFDAEQIMEVVDAVREHYPDKCHNVWHEDEMERWFEEEPDIVMSVDVSDACDYLARADICWHLDNGWKVSTYYEVVSCDEDVDILDEDFAGLIFEQG